MDEPTLGLDKRLKDALSSLIKELKGKNNAIIVITYDIEFAATFADRVILLNDGAIIADGRANKILADPELIKMAH
jgi:energy-coupling factor transport system ATP-binding protein